VSTDYVFDERRGNYFEGDSPNPVNFYGCTKLAGERVVAEFSRVYSIVRPGAIFGAGKATGKVNFALWLL